MIQWYEGVPMRMIELEEGVVKFFTAQRSYGFIIGEDGDPTYFKMGSLFVPSFVHDAEWRWRLEIGDVHSSDHRCPNTYDDVLFQRKDGTSGTVVHMWCFKDDFDRARAHMNEEIRVATDAWAATQDCPRNLWGELPPMIAHLHAPPFTHLS